MNVPQESENDESDEQPGNTGYDLDDDTSYRPREHPAGEPLDVPWILIFIRKASGLSQSQLARWAGTSQSAVARYENGLASPSTKTLQRLAKAGGFEIRVNLIRTWSSNLSSERGMKIRKMRRDVVAALKKSGARNARIYGAVARGAYIPDGAIELLVDFKRAPKPDRIPGLNQVLSDLLGEIVCVNSRYSLERDEFEIALKEAVPL